MISFVAPFFVFLILIPFLFFLFFFIMVVLQLHLLLYNSQHDNHGSEKERRKKVTLAIGHLVLSSCVLAYLEA